MAAGATPKIRLSLSEWGHMLIGFGALVWPMMKALFGNAPWRMFGSVEAKTAYWRNIALVMIRTGGHWFSIRHLQYLMPNDRNACRIWGWMNGTSVTTEEVSLLGSSGESSTNGTERNPSIHWIGPTPSRISGSNGGAQASGQNPRSKVLLYIHGGGFVLPLSNGSITMMKTLLLETNAANYGAPVYLALAEYTISPYAEYPTQIRQCIALIQFLHTQYGIDSSNLVIAGDSCGGSICLSIISQFLHPSPILPPLPYTKDSSPPLAGILLMSPWTSFATTSASYTSNSGSDTLPPNVIRRFRDTYMPQSGLESAPGTDAYKRFEPIEVASITGPYYEAVPDPVIKDLERGAGATRPLSSFAENVSNDGNDNWWSEIGSVTRKVMITAGEDECFRDDIVDFARRLQKVAGKQRATKNSATVEDEAAVEIQLVLDDSFHAVLVSDFAFGIPPGVLAARLSEWLVKALRS